MSDPAATQGWYGGYSYSQTSELSILPIVHRGLSSHLQDKIMGPSQSTKLPKSIPEVSSSLTRCQRPRFNGLYGHHFRPCRFTLRSIRGPVPRTFSGRFQAVLCSVGVL